MDKKEVAQDHAPPRTSPGTRALGAEDSPPPLPCPASCPRWRLQLRPQEVLHNTDLLGTCRDPSMVLHPTTQPEAFIWRLGLTQPRSRPGVLTLGTGDPWGMGGKLWTEGGNRHRAGHHTHGLQRVSRVGPGCLGLGTSCLRQGRDQERKSHT